MPHDPPGPPGVPERGRSRDDRGLLPLSLVGRLGAVLYLGSGLVSLVTLPLPQGPDANILAQFLVSVAALSIGGLAWYAPWHRWPRGTTLVLVVPALALIGAGNIFSGSTPLTYGILFVVVFVWIGLSQPRWTSVAFAGPAALAYMLPILLRTPRSGEDLASTAFTIPVCVLVAEAMAWAASRFAHTREELAKTEARYQALVEQVPALIYVQAADEPGTTLYLSPQSERILGQAPEDGLLDAASWAERIHPLDRSRVLGEHGQAAASGQPFRSEYRIGTPDGRTIWVRDEAMPVRDASGRPILWQGIMLDITERKGAEEDRRRLLASLVNAQEEERRRIATDLHDDPIQVMSAAGMRLQMFRRRVSDPKQLEELSHLQDIVTRAVDRLRHLLFELRPYALDRDGLAAALRLYLDERSKDEGSPAFHLESTLTREPAGEIRLILYRAAQEAIVNATKHAQASKVSITLEQRGDAFVLRVGDDGVGFRVADALGRPRAGHLGLAAIRERAELAGGSCRISTERGRGTVLELSIPSGEPSPRPELAAATRPRART